MFRFELDSSEEEHEQLLDNTDYHKPSLVKHTQPSTPNFVPTTDVTFITTDSKFEESTNGVHSDVGNSFDVQSNLNKNNEPQFICHYCDAKFYVRGYLTRHIKKHAIVKAYKCPFYRKPNSTLQSKTFVTFVTSIRRPIGNNNSTCHPTGGFSRRDTYKTHLKTRHIVYPAGIKPAERSKVGGHCTQCGEFTKDLNNWVEEHIENGKCTGLPQDYLISLQSTNNSNNNNEGHGYGNNCIGNRRYGKNSINGRLQMIKVSNGESRFVSSVESEMEPNVLLNNKNAVEAMAIMAHRANQNNLLSKYGDNKIIMQGFSEQDETRDMKPSITTQVDNVTNSQTEKRNSVEKLLDDLSIFEFDYLKNDLSNLNGPMDNKPTNKLDASIFFDTSF